MTYTSYNMFIEIIDLLKKARKGVSKMITEKTIEMKTEQVKSILSLLEFVEYNLLSEGHPKLLIFRSAAIELRAELENEPVLLSESQIEIIYDLLRYAEYGLLTEKDEKMLDYRLAANRLQEKSDACSKEPNNSNVEETKSFYVTNGGYYIDAKYVSKQQLEKMNVRYYFTEFNDNDTPSYTIYHDGNYHEFYYTIGN